jgi:hypothetical protein
VNISKLNNKTKIAMLGAVIALPVICGVVATKWTISASNSLEQQVFGVDLLPEAIAQTQGIHVFAIVLLTTMVIIAGILGGIVLSRRISLRNNEKKQIGN